jgi:hypothetical protein
MGFEASRILVGCGRGLGMVPETGNGSSDVNNRGSENNTKPCDKRRARTVMIANDRVFKPLDDRLPVTQ